MHGRPLYQVLIVVRIGLNKSSVVCEPVPGAPEIITDSLREPVRGVNGGFINHVVDFAFANVLVNNLAVALA